jgi:FtsP/CotA-like multicopper oxidase with cupredoxin domain
VALAAAALAAVEPHTMQLQEASILAAAVVVEVTAIRLPVVRELLLSLTKKHFNHFTKPTNHQKMGGRFLFLK